jgi:hypothetical protein
MRARDPELQKSRDLAPYLALTQSPRLMFCPIRHKTPVGSTTTKSRIPHGLSAGGSTLTPYLAANP